MKTTLTVIFMAFTFAANAQMSGDTMYTSKVGSVFKIGQLMSFGQPSLASGQYAYCHNVFMMSVSPLVSGQLAGKMGMITKFVVDKQKYQTVVSAKVKCGSAIFPYVDIDNALATKEVIGGSKPQQ